jgi:hypothetical protein
MRLYPGLYVRNIPVARSSIVGSEELVALCHGVSLSSHPVTEEEGGEEADEGGVDGADAVSPDVDGPANNPEIRKTLYFLKIDS